MKYRSVAITALFCLVSLSGLRAAEPMPTGDMSWWYRAPATKFWEGLPLGTGRFAAMVYGQVRDETIVFNDETLWAGSPYNPVNPNGLNTLPAIRKAVLDGRYAEAQKLCDDNLFSYPHKSVQNYQAMGRLHLSFSGQDQFSDYCRELDMDSATARVRYRVGDAVFRREVFASYPDQVVVIRLTCDQPGRLGLKVRLDSLQASAKSRAEGESDLVMEGGTIMVGGITNLMKWQSRVRVIARGGRIHRSEVAAGNAATRACIAIENADEVRLVLAGATSYVRWNDISGDPAARCAKYMAAAAYPYDTLRQRHLDDYQPRFRACQLDLGRRRAMIHSSLPSIFCTVDTFCWPRPAKEPWRSIITISGWTTSMVAGEAAGRLISTSRSAIGRWRTRTCPA
ncbi:MAG: glycoside hydrolase family 95 protein [Verrucomicrobia bacterium]|nr:glycoside hydrolase family 95 protein [Verrucomicrobiota bacterium]